jgi:hypothetical protein
MASALKFSTTLRNSIASNFGSTFNGGILIIYNAAPPANPQADYVGTALAVIPLPVPAFGSPATGVISKAGTWSAGVQVSGTAAGFRLKSADLTFIIDGTAGITSDTVDLVLDNKVLVAGGTVTVTACTITQPE